MVVLICTPGLDLEVNLSVPAPRGEKTQKHTENGNVSAFCGPQRDAVYVSIWWLRHRISILIVRVRTEWISFSKCPIKVWSRNLLSWLFDVGCICVVYCARCVMAVVQVCYTFHSIPSFHCVHSMKGEQDRKIYFRCFALFTEIRILFSPWFGNNFNGNIYFG